jgi:hypothetical protein
MTATVLIDRLWEFALDEDLEAIRAETEAFLRAQPDALRSRAQAFEAAWLEKVETPEVGGYGADEPARRAFDEARLVLARFV